MECKIIRASMQIKYASKNHNDNPNKTDHFIANSVLRFSSLSSAIILKALQQQLSRRDCSDITVLMTLTLRKWGFNIRYLLEVDNLRILLLSVDLALVVYFENHLS